MSYHVRNKIGRELMRLINSPKDGLSTPRYEIQSAEYGCIKFRALTDAIQPQKGCCSVQPTLILLASQEPLATFRLTLLPTRNMIRMRIRSCQPLENILMFLICEKLALARYSSDSQMPMEEKDSYRHCAFETTSSNPRHPHGSQGSKLLGPQIMQVASYSSASPNSPTISSSRRLSAATPGFSSQRAIPSPVLIPLSTSLVPTDMSEAVHPI